MATTNQERVGKAMDLLRQGLAPFVEREVDDEKATSPGDVLRELFVECGPCLILIDEWVAYARQLHDLSDLPAGSFDTMFTFAQTPTESAKLANNCLLVVSLPASDTGGAPHTQADDVEVSGIPGRDALDRLRSVHQLIRALESDGEAAAAELVAKLGSKAEFARELCYRLYPLCERNKRAAEALSYNSLVRSFPELERLAKEPGRKAPAQASMLVEDDE